MREPNPDRRMQIRGVGELMHPGCCCICGSGNRTEGYVDIGVYYDYEGQVYICQICAEELAETAGCLTPGESKHLQAMNEKLASENSTLIIALDEANEQLTKLNSVIRAALGPHSDLIGGLMADSTTPEESDANQPQLFDVTAGATGDGTNSQPIAVKSVKGRGRSESERDELRDERTAGSISL